MIQPKYRIGQKVWRAGVGETRDMWPCPDCNGSQTMTAMTAAGEAVPIMCLRCQSPDLSRIPSLLRVTKTVSLSELTIGSVRTDSAAQEGRQVSYMCVETGVGSGAVYYEPELYANSFEAGVQAEKLADEAQQQANAKPAALRAAEYAKLPLTAAWKYHLQAESYQAWRTATRYREAIEEVLELPDDHEPDAAKCILSDALIEHSWQKPDWPKMFAALGIEVPA